MNFKVGETVIALKSNDNEIQQPRTRGKSYVVLAVQYCSACGRQAINVSGKLPKGRSDKTRCSKCENRQHNNGLHWTAAIYFTKPELLKEVVKEAIGSEDYELLTALQENKHI